MQLIKIIILLLSFSSTAEAFGVVTTQKTRSSLATTPTANSKNGRWSQLPAFAQRTLSSQTSLSSTVNNESSSSSAYPAMSTKEIENFLSNTPIYAITVSQQEKLNAGGLVMLSEPENPYNIACFFFNPLHANNIFAPLREKSNIKWDVTGFSLGGIWMDVMKNEFDNNSRCVKDDVEYRILADPKDLMEARTLLEEAATKEEGGGQGVPSIFQSAFNEIPVFFHDKLRLLGENENEVLFPMYLSLQDLKEAHAQSIGSSQEVDEEQYKTEVKIGDLRTIVEQMQSDSSTTDYRKVVLVPPTPPEQPSTTSSSSGVDEKQSNEDESDGDTALKLPTTGDWSD